MRNFIFREQDIMQELGNSDKKIPKKIPFLSLKCIVVQYKYHHVYINIYIIFKFIPQKTIKKS